MLIKKIIKNKKLLSFFVTLYYYIRIGGMEKGFIIIVLIMFQISTAIEVLKTDKLSEVIAGIGMMIMAGVAVSLV